MIVIFKMTFPFLSKYVRLAFPFLSKMSEISLKIGKIFLTFLEMADLENLPS
jgi:hypothetical protein